MGMRDIMRRVARRAYTVSAPNTEPETLARVAGDPVGGFAFER